MLLSIIIPLFNTERYIYDCLTSIIDDNVIKEYEIIIVDDGSTDNSATIVKAFCEDYKNIILIQQSNHGVSFARMTGVSKSQGDYIWFIDSDDYLKKGSIKGVLKTLQSNPQIDTFASSLIIHDKESGEERLQWPGKTVTTVLKGREFMRIQPASVCPPQFIFKKRLFKNKWLTFPLGVRHEDEYFCRVLQYISSSIMVLDNPIYVYRQWQGSFMNSPNINSIYDMVEVYKRLAQFADQAIDEKDKSWFYADILSFLMGTHSWNSHLFGSKEFNTFRNANLPFIWQQFQKYSRLLPLKERFLGGLLLKKPALHKSLLSLKNLFKHSI